MAVTAERIVIADASLGVLVVDPSEFRSSASPPLTADIDRDGRVGFSDFIILATNFGQSVDVGTNGDLNESGTVDFADFLLLAAEFGSIA